MKNSMTDLNNRHGRNYDAAPDEVKPTLMAIAKVEQAVQETRNQKIRR
ncbi:hypothetical protein [Celeribacter sp.]